MARDLEVEARLTLKTIQQRPGQLDAAGKRRATPGRPPTRWRPRKGRGAQAYERRQAADKAATAIDIDAARSADRARDASGQFVSGSGSGLGRVAQDAARAERRWGVFEAMARRTGTAFQNGGAMGTARDVGATMAGGMWRHGR